MMHDDLIKFKNGDEKAFEKIYLQYWNKVFQFTRLYISDVNEQEEIVQQVFVRLWEKRAMVDESRDLDGFLFIVTRNMIFNRSRRSFNEKAYKDAMEAIGGGSSYDMEEHLDASDLQKYIDKLISLLPARQKEAFILSRKGGFSTKEIARKMDISEKGVERHIYLALKFIKANLPLLIIFLTIK
ncbi:MAG: RNA polymerase sigma-70 factor [Bacteroidales bacterium]|nr:RNA polymerase sigma-70 factor [Bacteroidales bacterium]MBR6731924.1 RNA polymerase sigma-70 factor [Bacteroidales bacterium]